MTEHPIPDERIQQLARQFEQYPDSGPIATLRGDGIVQFARALLQEVHPARGTYTPPGTHGSAAAPKGAG